jgi:hypothetical protein
MADFLRKSAAAEADIIAIQEPWKNRFIDDTHHPIKQSHHLLYPPGTGGAEGTVEEDRARVCMFVSRNLHTGAWSHVAYSRDCQELRLRYKRTNGEEEEERELRVINIYN